MARPELDPGDYVVGDDVDVPNADLDEEVFTYHGNRLYESDAERLADVTLESIRRGQASLSQIRRDRDAAR